MKRCLTCGLMNLEEKIVEQRLALRMRSLYSFLLCLSQQPINTSAVPDEPQALLSRASLRDPLGASHLHSAEAACAALSCWCLSEGTWHQFHTATTECPRWKNDSFSGLDSLKRPLWSLLHLEATLVSVVCCPRLQNHVDSHSSPGAM